MPGSDAGRKTERYRQIGQAGHCFESILVYPEQILINWESLLYELAHICTMAERHNDLASV